MSDPADLLRRAAAKARETATDPREPVGYREVSLAAAEWLETEAECVDLDRENIWRRLFSGRIKYEHGPALTVARALLDHPEEP